MNATNQDTVHRELGNHVGRFSEATNRFIMRAIVLGKKAGDDSALKALLSDPTFAALVKVVSDFNRWADARVRIEGLEREAAAAGGGR